MGITPSRKSSHQLPTPPIVIYSGSYPDITRLWNLEGNLLGEYKDIGEPLIFNSDEKLLIGRKGR